MSFGFSNMNFLNNLIIFIYLVQSPKINFSALFAYFV